jgi:hypothetical protein
MFEFNLCAVEETRWGLWLLYFRDGQSELKEEEKARSV